ncbi:MAG: succinyl-diaminopimelate desuccinylase, partial [Pseudomonadota bacterium]|nr:succinyl-diaminopimelate desuccinylase [Pseudomonadota bacterium]
MPKGPSASNLLVELVRAPSVTPDVGLALDVLEGHLAAAGFDVSRPTFQAPGTLPVENLFAVIGQGERHLTFAGHVDVVPPGPEDRWRYPPFSAECIDG